MTQALIALAVALAIALPASTGSLAQGRVVAALMKATGRNPEGLNSLFVPFIIGLAFIESLVLYALVIAFILLAKV